MVDKPVLIWYDCNYANLLPNKNILFGVLVGIAVALDNVKRKRKDKPMEKLFKNITGGMTEGREHKLNRIMQFTELPLDAFDIVECSDEHTGRRFGQAACRIGFAYKLGGGGRNRGSRYAYQVWAVVKPEYRD